MNSRNISINLGKQVLLIVDITERQVGYAE